MFVEELTQRYLRRAEDEAKKTKDLDKKISTLIAQRDNAVMARLKAETNLKSVQKRAKADARISAQEKETLEMKLKTEVQRREEAETKLAKAEKAISSAGDDAVKAFMENAEMTEILLGYVEPISDMGYARGRLEGQLDLRRRVKRRYPGDKCFLLDMLDAPLPAFWQLQAVEPLLRQIAETLNHRSLATELDVEEGSLEEDMSDMEALAPAYPHGLPASSSIMAGVSSFSFAIEQAPPTAQVAHEASAEATPTLAEVAVEAGGEVPDLPVLPPDASVDPAAVIPPAVQHPSPSANAASVDNPLVLE